MRQRVTVTIEHELERKIRSKQAQLIQENGRNVSFSRTLETIIAKSLDVAETHSPFNNMGYGMDRITSSWQ